VTHYVVFNLETVPDLVVARRLLGLDAAVPDDAVRKAIGQRYARPDQDPSEVFLKAPFHRVACIGVLYAERERDGPFTVRSIGARHIGERSEAQLISGFVGNLPQDEFGKGPVLVSFNGGGFDLPVLRYRAMALGVGAPALFGRNGRDYWYRFGWDHLDLCDLLSGFGASAKPSLNEMAALLNIPTKLDGIDGLQVEVLAASGRLDEIATYCLGDVITTFHLLLRFALVRGEIDEVGMARSKESLDEALDRQAKLRPSLSAVIVTA
jgi:predicted PolB exonuclease-like 3'-5' exonuclease